MKHRCVKYFYNIVPYHTTTGLSRTELLAERKLTIRLSRVHPDLQLRMYEKETVVKEGMINMQSRRVYGGRSGLCSHVRFPGKMDPRCSRKKRSGPVSVHVRVTNEQIIEDMSTMYVNVGHRYRPTLGASTLTHFRVKGVHQQPGISKCQYKNQTIITRCQ